MKRLLGLTSKVSRVLADAKICQNHRITNGLWRRLLALVWGGMIGLVLVFMAFLVWHSRDILFRTLQAANYWYFLGTFVAYAFAIGAVALGWHLVMHHLEGQSNLVLNVKIYVYTLVTRRLPGPLLHIAGRLVLYQRLGVSKRVTSLASVIEMILSIVSGLIVGAPALFLQMEITLSSIVIFSFVEVVGLCLLYPKILHWLLTYFGHRIELRCLTIPRVISWLGTYMLMWISGGLMIVTVVFALYPLSLSQIPSIISLWALSGALSFVVVLVPSGLGVSEITLSFLLSRIVPLPIAITTALLVRVLTTIFDIMWSSLFLLDKSDAISAR